MAQTRHAWIDALEALSPKVKALDLKSSLEDIPYWDAATKVAYDADAYNLSSCDTHNANLARWIEGLAHHGVDDAQLTKHVTDLTKRNTYGAFAELSAYGFLLDNDIKFDIQVAMPGADILNPNGSDLDGRLTISSDVFFDVKAFGLHEYLSDRLNTLLSAHFPTEFVAIEGSADVGTTNLRQLLGGQDYADLVSELTTQRKAQRGNLDIKLFPPQPVQMTTTTANPYELAQNHAEYAFNFAKQFVRAKPFILIFVIHPWLGGNRLSTNFAGEADVFTRSLARRTFMQFDGDMTPLFGTTRRDAARLLSGILFIDTWPLPPHRPKHRLFLNPNATNPMPMLSRHHLELVSNLSVDDFRHDTY
ncbi:MAG: hypothetical protein ACK4RV_13770 [Caulobacter sp.]